MLLGIPDKDKIRLSAFINDRFKQWVRNNPTQNKDVFYVGICSKSEFYQILQGQILDDNGVYDYLLQKCGYAYNYDDMQASDHMAIAKRMLEDLEYDQMATFYQRLRMYRKELEPMRSYALESVNDQVASYLLEMDLSNRSFSRLLAYFPMLDSYMKEVVGYFLLTYIHEHMQDVIDDKWLAQHGLRHLKALRNRYRILNFLIRWELYYDASYYCENLLKACQRANNVRVAFMTQISRLFIVMKIQPSLFEKYANVVLDNPVFQEESTDPHTYEFYHVVGLYYFIERNYKQARHYFLRSVVDDTYYFPEIIFLNYIATLTGKKLPEELCVQRDLASEDRIYKPIYTYYCLKNKLETPHLLQDYLWMHCTVAIKWFSPSWVMKEIIQEEFEWIASQTGDTKDLERFRRLMQEEDA